MYSQRQISWLMLGILIVLLCVAWINIIPSSDKTVQIVFGITLPLILMFTRMTVLCDNDTLKIRFLLGLFSKKFLLKDIASYTIVRNRWYYGWGIRKIPGGWLYNMSGLDAIEFLMKDGKMYRIGTVKSQDLYKHLLSKLG